MKRSSLILILFLTLLGIADSGYLTYEHFARTLPPCSTNLFIDCGKVLGSPYSLLFGIPVALIGIAHYSILFFNVLLALITGKKLFKFIVVTLSVIGAFASIYFTYLQLIVIGSICLYCTFSAIISFAVFALVMIYQRLEKKELLFLAFGFFYRNFLRKIFFLTDPEFIHERMLSNGEILGRLTPINQLIGVVTRYKDPRLKQKIAGINFDYPVGLAAGFDYEAKLPVISASLGFGFQTVGTITNLPYEGNPKPRLGRLPRSRSLMVNKGFKNPGVDEIIRRLEGEKFQNNIGISIGRTNTIKLSSLKSSIDDIVLAFKKFESAGRQAKINHSYYELNISCPNIIHGKNISFYPPKNLDQLLTAVKKIKIDKPIFIKMPIELTDNETVNILEIIAKHKITGVIFGNLQKNRKDPALVKEEVEKWKVGYFSGKPTFVRSNELIRLAFKKFGIKLIIIGCGGIFSADDAYAKIKLGASLIQLITGMIYQGPQLIPQINLGLIDRLKQDGFKNIREAVGTGV